MCIQNPIFLLHKPALVFFIQKEAKCRDSRIGNYICKVPTSPAPGLCHVTYLGNSTSTTQTFALSTRLLKCNLSPFHDRRRSKHYYIYDDDKHYHQKIVIFMQTINQKGYIVPHFTYYDAIIKHAPCSFLFCGDDIDRCYYNYIISSVDNPQ